METLNQAPEFFYAPYPCAIVVTEKEFNLTELELQEMLLRQLVYTIRTLILSVHIGNKIPVPFHIRHE